MQNFYNYSEFCMTKKEYDQRSVEMSMKAQLFPWHMSEKSKLLSHFSTSLTKSLNIFNSERF